MDNSLIVFAGRIHQKNYQPLDTRVHRYFTDIYFGGVDKINAKEDSEPMSQTDKSVQVNNI